MSDEHADESKRPAIECPQCHSRDLIKNRREPGRTSCHCRNCLSNFDWDEPTIDDDPSSRLFLSLIPAEPDLRPTMTVVPRDDTPGARDAARRMANGMRSMGLTVVADGCRPSKPGPCPKCKSARTGWKDDNFRCYHCNHRWNSNVCPSCQSLNVGGDDHHMRCYQCGNAWATVDNNRRRPATAADNPATAAEIRPESAPNPPAGPGRDARLSVDFGDGATVELTPDQVASIRDRMRAAPILVAGAGSAPIDQLAFFRKMWSILNTLISVACPTCRSADVDPAYSIASEGREGYRCRACGRRFETTDDRPKSGDTPRHAPARPPDPTYRM